MAEKKLPLIDAGALPDDLADLNADWIKIRAADEAGLEAEDMDTIRAWRAETIRDREKKAQAEAKSDES